MRPEYNARLTFMANAERRIIILRPIGDLSAREFIDQAFEHYARIDAPWTYNRLTDVRRFTGYLSDKDLTEMAARWRDLTEGHDYHAHVAVVSLDIVDRVRIPAVSPMFPNETICMFSDYHEAMGWLSAANRTQYLSGLGPLAASRHGDDDTLRID